MRIYSVERSQPLKIPSRYLYLFDVDELDLLRFSFELVGRVVGFL